MLHTRDLSGSITVDDVDYKWTLHREPQWCTVDGYQGMAITVVLEEGPRRMAILQYPFPQNARRSTPHRQRPKVERRQLEDGIRQALAEGWEPTSKGKPVTYELGQAGI